MAVVAAPHAPPVRSTAVKVVPFYVFRVERRQGKPANGLPLTPEDIRQELTRLRKQKRPLICRFLISTLKDFNPLHVHGLSLVVTKVTFYSRTRKLFFEGHRISRPGLPYKGWIRALVNQIPSCKATVEGELSSATCR